LAEDRALARGLLSGCAANGTRPAMLDVPDQGVYS
jgi:hypothetical protein